MDHGYSVHEVLNRAPLSRFHYRALVTAGMGFFTDAYDLFIIGMALVLIRPAWHLGDWQVGLLGSATLLASFAGAVGFGRLADRWGRKRIYGVEAAIMAGAALATACAPNFWWLLAFRLLLGLGVGGDYPVSAVIMSEYANARDRGRLVGMVFAMQAAGLVVGPLVALALFGAGVPTDFAWRVMLGLGAVPALAVIGLRRQLPESPRFVARVRGDVEAAAQAVERVSGGVLRVVGGEGLRVERRLRDYLRVLVGTAGCWFLFDYAYYGNTIATPVILRWVAPHASLITETWWTLALFAGAALPGYVLAFSTMDRVGHRRLQRWGFVAMALAFAVLAAVPGLTTAAAPFLTLYGLSYFFAEFGPNTTTFVLAAEVFPVNLRATGHGLSAGVAKLGAFLGVFLFPILAAHLDLAANLAVCAGAAAAGALLTGILPEPAGRALEEVAGEEAALRRIERVGA
ncbi:MAG: MFS transporter [Firmicutes bacterium]|nr:MFS transporter [Alicyclobacillaceae bacterium]MCL6496060.1 MFS transporter [Bacillota bacterium]